jgi:hypothetical protein
MEQVLSDELIVERLKEYVDPDESEFYYIFGQYQPGSWLQVIFLFLFGWILAALGSAATTKNYFIGLTNRRLLLMHVSLTYDQEHVESFDTSDIGGVKIEDSSMEKTIHITICNGKKYKIKARKKMHVVKNQQENLEKICERLTV